MSCKRSLKRSVNHIVWCAISSYLVLVPKNKTNSPIEYDKDFTGKMGLRKFLEAGLRISL